MVLYHHDFDVLSYMPFLYTLPDTLYYKKGKHAQVARLEGLFAWLEGLLARVQGVFARLQACLLIICLFFKMYNKDEVCLLK